MNRRAASVANFIKGVHKSLKYRYYLKNDEAWTSHLQQEELLAAYASAMQELSTVHWEEAKKNNDIKECRIFYVKDTILRYFRNQDDIIGISRWLTYDEKWRMRKHPDDPSFNSALYEPRLNGKLKLLDVGSCYNPFLEFEDFDVTALDIAPAVPSVHRADFSTVPVLSSEELTDSEDLQLEKESFDAIILSFVMTYIPSPHMRWLVCRKAFELLVPNGLLVLTTPDQKNKAANVGQIKSWRQALQLLGFWKVDMCKKSTFHGLTVRKSLSPNLTKEVAMHELVKDRRRLRAKKMATGRDNGIERNNSSTEKVHDEEASFEQELQQFNISEDEHAQMFFTRQEKYEWLLHQSLLKKHVEEYPCGDGDCDNEESLAVDNEKSLAVDNEKSLAVDSEKSLAVDNEKSLAVDNEKSLAVDNEKSLAVDNEKSLAVDNEKSLAVDNDELLAGK